MPISDRLSIRRSSQNHSQPAFQAESSDALLRAIVQSSDDAIITKRLDGTITSWNPAATRLFGYLPEEILGHPILKLIPEELHSEEEEIIRKLRAGEQIAHYETVRLAKGGRRVEISVIISPVRNQHGEVVGASEIARDIIEQKLLGQARSRLAAIVESSDDAIISKDLNGIIKSWNKAATRIFGYSEEEIVGSSILKLIPAELHSEEYNILKKLKAGERIDHFETTRLHKNGDRLDVSLTISPVKDSSGKVVGASKVLRDVTDRKRLQRSLVEAEAIAATGKMAATIAHEINNPLEALVNSVYLAKLNASNPEQVVAFLSMAESELERVSHIAKQTLGYYREYASTVEIQLGALVQEVLKIYSPKLQSAGIELDEQLPPTQPVMLRKGEMIQVISNLITNAIHAMPSGGRLTVTVQDVIRSGHSGALLSVADQGVGIPSELLKKIFEPFFTTRHSVGTGIGLWIAKQFVEGHGGTIEVRSSVDSVTRGTTMSLFIPHDNPYSLQKS